MKKIIYIIIAIFGLITMFIGGNYYQQQRERAIADSVKASEEKKFSLKNRISGLTSEYDHLNTLIKQNEDQLLVEYDRLAKVEEFHFFRTTSERESQISSQSMVILNQQDKIKSLELALQDTENKLRSAKSSLTLLSLD